MTAKFTDVNWSPFDSKITDPSVGNPPIDFHFNLFFSILSVICAFHLNLNPLAAKVHSVRSGKVDVSLSIVFTDSI